VPRVRLRPGVSREGAPLGRLLADLVNFVKAEGVAHFRRAGGITFWLLFGKQVSKITCPDYNFWVPAEDEIWLERIKAKALAGAYTSVEAFMADVRQIVDNCAAYNAAGHGKHGGPSICGNAAAFWAYMEEQVAARRPMLDAAAAGGAAFAAGVPLEVAVPAFAAPPPAAAARPPPRRQAYGGAAPPPRAPRPPRGVVDATFDADACAAYDPADYGHNAAPAAAEEEFAFEPFDPNAVPEFNAADFAGAVPPPRPRRSSWRRSGRSASAARSGARSWSRPPRTRRCSGSAR
jgi:hypothetical protein